MRAAPAVTAALVVLGLAAGCANEPAPEEPLAIDAHLDAPSGSAEPSSPGDAEPGDRGAATRGDGDARVVVGRLPASGPGRAAALAYVDYLTVRSEAFNTVQVDLAELSSVAIGDALEDVRSGVAYRSREKLHMVGDVKVDVGRAVVRGRSAAVTACLTNSTAEANRSGRVVETDPTPFYRAQVTVRRYGPDVWLVSRAEFEETTGC